MTMNKLFDGVMVFTQVVKTGGFSAAAELMGHSTSYISKEVSKLEERLGVRLLNRTTRSIGLTPEGKAYYQECQQLVADAEQAVNMLTQHEVAPKGTLRLSTPVGFGNNYLQPILAEYMRLYPNVSLDLDLNDRKVDVVAEGYDLAIRASLQLEESSLICRKVFSCKGYIVASPGYLSKHGHPHHPQELSRHNCFCYSNHKSPNKWQFNDKEGKPYTVEVRQKLVCNSAEMELALVLDDLGICRLPMFYMEDKIKSGKLVILFEELPAPEIDVFVVYPSRKHQSPKVRAFIDLTVDYLATR
ncbi:LysR family transcriptional regulator [Shewanella violacea]|uniref:Transcriptional regulator, LysR family n=1 Tax=Shewanella violacea (strain JCM 10179 / CIP 106290 / LMG 19151 / DSS12) TaxID=637905 RepID=D4ZBQ9_SHEVD|nr:LysR family transcriptional regulator [Shewanella violacea]BAJ03454.1 transcriptional regulator, LysR family [Shewanella violacea DSS12]